MMNLETLFLIGIAVGLCLVLLAVLFRGKLPAWAFMFLVLLGTALAAAGLIVTLSFLAIQVRPLDD